MARSRRVFIYFLLGGLALPAYPLPGREECAWRCNRTVDTAECAEGRFGARDCRVVSGCTVFAIDPDGPGGNDPIIGVTCQYDCALESCIWV